jgi:hypothetical protein
MSDPNPSPTTRMETPTPDAAPTDAAAPDAAPTATAPPTAATPPEPGPAVQPPAAAPPPASSPPWHPPDSGNPGRIGSIIVGLILLGVGAWFFADQTLGLDMPSLSWGQLWPLVLVVVGGWILLAGFRRGSR